MSSDNFWLPPAGSTRQYKQSRFFIYEPPKRSPTGTSVAEQTKFNYDNPQRLVTSVNEMSVSAPSTSQASVSGAAPTAACIHSHANREVQGPSLFYGSCIYKQIGSGLNVKQSLKFTVAAVVVQSSLQLDAGFNTTIASAVLPSYATPSRRITTGRRQHFN